MYSGSSLVSLLTSFPADVSKWPKVSRIRGRVRFALDDNGGREENGEKNLHVFAEEFLALLLVGRRYQLVRGA